MGGITKETLKAYLDSVAECLPFCAEYVLCRTDGERNRSVAGVVFNLPGEESLLGYGAFAYVFCCKALVGGGRFAVKVLLKTRAPHRGGTSTALALKEIDMLETFSAIFSDRIDAQEFKATFDSENATLIVTSYLSGRTLHEHVAEMNQRGTPPEEQAAVNYPFAAQLVRELAILLHFFHQIRAIHRDVSARNVMYHFPHSGTPFFTFIDFGLSSQLEPLPGPGRVEERARQQYIRSDGPVSVGSRVHGNFEGLGYWHAATVTANHGDGTFDLSYDAATPGMEPHGSVDCAGMGTIIAPENRADCASPDGRTIYDERGDCWACGALLYFIVTQGLAFDRDAALARLEALPMTERHASPYDLVLRLTRSDPALRFSMKDALNHAWLQKVSPMPPALQRKLEQLRLEAEQMLRGHEWDQEARDVLVRSLITRRNSLGGSDEEGDDEAQAPTTAELSECEHAAAAAGVVQADADAAWAHPKAVNQARYFKRQNSRELSQLSSSISNLVLGAASPLLRVSSDPQTLSPLTPSWPHTPATSLGSSGRKKSDGRSGRGGRREGGGSDAGDDYVVGVASDSASDVSGSSRSSSRSALASWVVSRASTPRLPDQHQRGSFVDLQGVQLLHSQSHSSLGLLGMACRRRSLAGHEDGHEALMQLSDLKLAVQQHLDSISLERASLDGRIEDLRVEIAEEQQELRSYAYKICEWRFPALPDKVKNVVHRQLIKVFAADISDKRLGEVLVSLRAVKAELFGRDAPPEPPRKGKGKRQLTPAEQVNKCLLRLGGFHEVLARLVRNRRALIERQDRLLHDMPHNGVNLMTRVTKYLKTAKAREASKTALVLLGDCASKLAALLQALQSLSVDAPDIPAP